MIRTHEQFEAALEEGARLLDAAPPEGTPDHRRLLALMQDIAAYRPAMRPTPPDKDPTAERLNARLRAFETQLAPELTPHWYSLIGADVSPHR